MRPTLFSAVMAVAAGSFAGGCAGGAGADDPVAVGESSLREHDEANPELFAVDSHPYGISMQEWAYNWLRWEYSIPAATNPTIVAGADYDQHQIGPVYFVPDGPNHNDAFGVPRHEAVAIMLSQIGNDYPCPDPNFKPAPGQSLFDFLSAGLTAINDNITVMEVTLDGKPVAEPLRYRFTSSRLFYFVGDKSLTASFDACADRLAAAGRRRRSVPPLQATVARRARAQDAHREQRRRRLRSHAHHHLGMIRLRTIGCTRELAIRLRILAQIVVSLARGIATLRI